ncbi:NAD(P)H-hydrate dehydratase [Altererythrobacter sp. CC-YST694]|uniref:NAD(P)H-hydrate dehydratase n=1 Tax=Altererythrobacter sp. CC-YST694 TaxID=2755038 RepID=UPI001D0283E7|nr:NAD(P)H-hydrate dehydratase [Altererythrobacter sp. CC-YST694]MCB5424635.1 NAD(P)H-hydrate dehydratase [Altererythrobacter sp. CC-YST694]
MRRASDQILTVAQMRDAEEALIAAGSSVDALMQIAGRGAAEWVWRLGWPKSVTVLCGPGNNGGDGYVIAEALRERGLPVTVVAPLAPGTDAARNARAAYRGEVLPSAEGLRGHVLVDCLFGSGLVRPLSPELFQMLRQLADSHPLRIAVDLPSGVESDSGRALNDHLPDYRLTICLGAWKFAHWTMPAAALMGERRLVSIGAAQVPGVAHLLGKPHLQAPAADAHKYTRGLLAVIPGAMPGAALLASEAAMRAGAGYVRLAAAQAPMGTPPDLVVDPQALGDPRLSAALLGPGLGRGAGAQARLGEVLAREVPLLLDADALVALTPAMLAGRRSPILATPHEGELTQLAVAFDIAAQGKRAVAQELARRTGMVVIAKGADTLIAAPDGRVEVARPAPSWLSVAGSGDVLAGIAASRLATGADPFTAACEAVWLHGEAARLAGPLLVPSGLVTHIPAAYARCL